MQRFILLFHPINLFGEGAIPHLQRSDVALDLFELFAELDYQTILPNDLLDVLLTDLISLLVELFHLVAGLLEASLDVSLATGKLLAVLAMI